MCGQMEFTAPGGWTGSASSSASSKTASPIVEASSGTGRSLMSSTGTLTESCQRFSAGGLMMVVVGPRKFATASIGRTVADRPMRWKLPASRRSRSSESERCTPRFVPARAWISSTMTVSTVFKMPAAFEVSMRYSDSGVVIRMSGGLRTCRLRSDCGVSPERTPTEMSGMSRPSFCATRAMPASGARRLFSTSTPSAFRGEM